MKWQQTQAFVIVTKIAHVNPKQQTRNNQITTAMNISTLDDCLLCPEIINKFPHTHTQLTIIMYPLILYVYIYTNFSVQIDFSIKKSLCSQTNERTTETLTYKFLYKMVILGQKWCPLDYSSRISYCVVRKKHTKLELWTLWKDNDNFSGVCWLVGWKCIYAYMKNEKSWNVNIQ